MHLYTSNPSNAKPIRLHDPDPWVPLGLAVQLVVLKMANRYATPPAVVAAHVTANGLGPQGDRR